MFDVAFASSVLAKGLRNRWRSFRAVQPVVGLSGWHTMLTLHVAEKRNAMISGAACVLDCVLRDTAVGMPFS